MIIINQTHDRRIVIISMIVHKSHHFNARNIIQHNPHQSTTFTPVPPLFPLLFFSASSFQGALLFFCLLGDINQKVEPLFVYVSAKQLLRWKNVPRFAFIPTYSL